jgi:hypothetical protein
MCCHVHAKWTNQIAANKKDLKKHYSKVDVNFGQKPVAKVLLGRRFCIMTTLKAFFAL